jgi:hypothetical protein
MKRPTDFLACLGLFAAGVVLAIPLAGRADGGSIDTSCNSPFESRAVSITSLVKDGVSQPDDLLARIHTVYWLTSTESPDRIHASFPSVDARVLVDFDAERVP